MMDRRAFIGTLAGGLLAAPLAAQAQQAGKVYRVGLVFTTAPVDQMSGLHASTLWSDRSWMNCGRSDTSRGGTSCLSPGLPRGGEILEGLVSLKVDVLVVNGNSMTQVAKEVTRVVPIVMAFVNDPAEDGLVATLAHPGGNVTGVASTAGSELEGKRVELLKEALPKIRRVAFLGTKSDWEDPFGRSTQAAARALSITLILAEHAPDEYGDAFARILHDHPDALLVPNTTSNFARRHLIVEFATKSRLPSMGYVRNFTEDGGLMSYGPDFRDQYRHLAVYVDKILKGARPADLPVEQPTKFELVINLKTAKALGLTIPPSLLQRADQVIE
jgi:putative tryptophan/tyrosine transport system substrate-binding protein